MIPTKSLLSIAIMQLCNYVISMIIGFMTVLDEKRFVRSIIPIMKYKIFRKLILNNSIMNATAGIRC